MADVRKDLELVICDIRLPDMSGEEVFDAMRGDEDLPPFLFVTGYGEVDQAVRLMRSGAVDFVTKPFRIGDFLTRIGAARRQVVSELDTRGYVLGCSHSVQAVEDLIRRYAMLDLPVLITGETGAGKEVAARLLHDLSPRAKEPFIAVNCAAIPAELLESELFGHEKGAFTGAHQRHLGYAERAKGGTLFLDEIGDMPQPLQVKLLRLMESKSFTRLGGETSVAFRARIVSATHQSLLNSSPASFREDLYFRLAVLPVEIAPLRERPDDILWLLSRFIRDAGTRSNRRIRGLTVLAEEASLAHFWQGNVRELRNRVERAVALAATDWIDIGDLFPEQAPSQASKPFATLADVRDAAERRQILRALNETEGHVTKAAELLGLGRTTLWEKMTRLQMAHKKDDAQL
jgi:DNA-binding NtrC family response regulator